MYLEDGRTDLQERFCQEYCIDFNGAQAAIRAGYSENGAAVMASRLLTQVNIQNRINEIKSFQLASLRVTRERVINELAKIAFADPSAIMEWSDEGVKLKRSSELSPDVLATISEVSETVTKDGGSIRVKMNDKQKALELLMRHLGIGVDKIAMLAAGNLVPPEIKIVIVDPEKERLLTQQQKKEE